MANRDDVRRRLQEAADAAAQGSNRVSVTDADIDDAIRRAEGYDGYTIDRSVGDFADQYRRRSAPTDGRQFDSQGPEYDQATNTLSPMGRSKAASMRTRTPRTIAELASSGLVGAGRPDRGGFGDLRTDFSWIQDENERRRLQSQAEGWGWGGRRPDQPWPPRLVPTANLPVTNTGRPGPRLQVQDRWGRSPSDPNYGVPPTVGALAGY